MKKYGIPNFEVGKIVEGCRIFSYSQAGGDRLPSASASVTLWRKTHGRGQLSIQGDNQKRHAPALTSQGSHILDSNEKSCLIIMAVRKAVS